MVASLLMRSEKSMAKRFKSISKTWTALFGGSKVGFSNATYLSERETAHRNSALGKTCASLSVNITVAATTILKHLGFAIQDI